MVSKAQKVKSVQTPKYSTQKYNRCIGCFRDNVIRYGRCRLCFKKDADRGDLTGFSKV
ncbi:MAG: type Z 30S ribosomal protein S14 [Candidatus Moeniiplasma glomeromycotorum]|nr:type Z 30S ribosomal protein S14 [Candidatus Moeniiplasma glomeromycotorum]MCE8162154.1 type Z 30S ribosomal protein S14 [Candidatus Moeniiplasma glomeromycotorum]MCE8163246.1 type Z 30S ribosomal protein S14 [Candidatus Moeniiplasma glomeromycotorum]MCE8166191.1 type Z 30S ribosomal protein S14 [Candidatus Moeniiplasma glomeromycotorum]MCE8166553.1 type Z 30S ribosomal protein S14 [Candidatus Moeniiplasma glomeromycotorum]